MEKPKRILVIEDDEDLRDIIRYILSEEGFEIYATWNGKQVKILISSLAPDLVFLDLRLGDAEGWRICRLLKSDHETAHIPVIILSTSGSKAIDMTKLHGADDCLLKPFDVADLVYMAHKYLDNYAHN